MPRNRHARKKTTTPVPGQHGKSINAYSSNGPIAGQVRDTQLIQLLVGSHILAAEPEFLDLEFDRQDAFDVAERHLKKNKKRIEAAEIKGTEVIKAAWDDLHKEIIDELITPDFLIEFKKRLRALQERMQMGDDLKKQQMVSVLETALESEVFPISMTGLVGQIYNRTIQQSMQGYREEKEFLDEMKKEINFRDANPQDFYTILETTEKNKHLEAELVKNPHLLQHLQRKTSKMLDDFEEKLGDGTVELDLFTLEELVLPFQRLTDTLGDPAQYFKESKVADREKVTAVVNKVISEIFTPERWQKFYNDVQDLTRKWVLARHTWSTALYAELGLLDKEKYQLSRFVMVAFFGQYYRLDPPEDIKPPKKRG